MGGTKESLVLYTWMPDTGLLLLNTPIFFQQMHFHLMQSPLKAMSGGSSNPEDLRTRTTHPPARLTTGHCRGVKRLRIWLSLLFLLSWSCPAGKGELEEVGRRNGGVGEG